MRLDPFLNSEKVLNVEKLKSLKGIDQIEKYRDYTNNFSPEGLAKLKPEEILHLNLCDWLAPQAKIINKRIKDAGGFKVRQIHDGIECVSEIYELDLFHSLLGEVRPGSVRDATKGGHLPIAELKSALFETGEIKSLGNGFFDMAIKRGSKFKNNSFFPVGKSVDQCVKMIEEAIVYSEKNLYIEIAENGKILIEVVNESNQKFALHVEKGIAKGYPKSIFVPQKK